MSNFIRVLVAVIRVLAAVILVGLAAFCVFGFLSAPEAGADAWLFRLLYGTIGVAVACGAGSLGYSARWRSA